MGFLFKRKKKEETVAIFDIGSGSVGGAIVHFPTEENELPIIIKTVRTEIDYINEKLSVILFTKNMLKALGITAEALYHTKAGAPDRIICVIASPWYSSETRIIKMSKESPFIFTEKMAEELLQKEIKSITLNYNKKTKTLYNELEIMEQHIMDVSLNGYQVESPIGMHTKSVEMNMIVSFSQKFFLDKIRKEISKTFHAIPVSFSSFIVASYFAVRDKYISPDSYLLVDVGGEMTEVGVVLKGILKASLSFPFGKKTFFKYMCTKLEVELRDAQELFNLYISGNLSAEKKKKIEPLFKSIENSWSESFRQSIGNLPHVLALPGTIFLTADSDMISWFFEVISNEQFIQSMTVGNKCNVVSLKGVDFLKMCKIEKDVFCDPFLMIEAIAVMRKKV
jgi:hypothetical protein